MGQRDRRKTDKSPTVAPDNNGANGAHDFDERGHEWAGGTTAPVANVPVAAARTAKTEVMGEQSIPIVEEDLRAGKRKTAGCEADFGSFNEGSIDLTERREMAAGAARSSVGEQYSRLSRAGNVFGVETESANTTEIPDEIALVRRATEVLGIEHVAGWMQSNIPSLDKQTPYSLMKTEDGRKKVERVLLRIEHGVY